MTKPLEGVRVLDIGTLLAGPWGATLLGDFGAEVIKVEQPKTGDSLRGAPRNGEPGNPLNWLIDSRNKKSITLNLRSSEGQQVLRELICASDVLFENFRPGTLEKWGLGWDTIHDLNRNLIMVSVSGYGQTGPYSDRPGYDRIALGFSGYMYPTGFPDRYPVRPAFATADYNTATFGAYAAMLALYARDVKKESGQLIDLALYEPPFRITSNLVASWNATGKNRERIGNRNPGFSPAGTFETKDKRFIQIAAGGDNVWQRLARVIGGEALSNDPRYTTSRDRIKRSNELETLIQDWIGLRDFLEVEEKLVGADVPVGGIYRASDIADDPHYRERESLINFEDPVHGTVSMPGIVPKLSKTPGSIERAGPDLGSHNEEIYGTLLGKSEAEIKALEQDGVI